MTDTDSLLASLKGAVQAAPSDVPLRLHLSTLLAGQGYADEAIHHAAAALHVAPSDAEARAHMLSLLSGGRAGAMGGPGGAGLGGGLTSGRAVPVGAAPGFGRPVGVPTVTPPGGPVSTGRPAPQPPTGRPDGRTEAAQTPQMPQTPPLSPLPGAPGSPVSRTVLPKPPLTRRGHHPAADAYGPPDPAPAPAGGTDRPADPGAPEADPRPWAPGESVPHWAPPEDLDHHEPEDEVDLAWQMERASVTLADIGGMVAAKDGLEAAILAPMRNPELRRLYRKSMTGGVMLYGPPGCGKRFLARAVAGELGVRFISVDLADLLQPGPGPDQGDLQQVYETVRAEGNVLVYLDAIDAFSHMGPARRALVQDLAARLDARNVGEDGVFVIAGTEAPWDVDVALRRPGRLDRALLVMPPDQQAREVILQQELDRLKEDASELDLAQFAVLTEGYSGVDISRLCEAAVAERDRRLDAAGAPLDEDSPLQPDDLRAALQEVPPTTEEWIERARRAARLEPDETTYAGLREYLRVRREHSGRIRIRPQA